MQQSGVKEKDAKLVKVLTKSFLDSAVLSCTLYSYAAMHRSLKIHRRQLLDSRAAWVGLRCLVYAAAVPRGRPGL